MSETCHEEGTVTALVGAGDRVQVTVERAEACGRCEARGACKVLGGEKKDLVLEVDNAVGAGVGDRVRLSIEEAAVVTASTVLYLVPALGIILGAAVGYLLAGRLGTGPDDTAVIGALAGLVLGLLASWLIGRRLSRGTRFVPVLTEVTERSAQRPAD